MNVTDWLVVAGGAAAIVWVNWYFFIAQRASVTARDEVTIIVKGGYDPAVIRVKSGEPVKLVFDRQESSGCSEEVVFPDFGVRKFLPAFQKTAIELTAPKPGRYGFTCGMSMLHGSLIAE